VKHVNAGGQRGNLVIWRPALHRHPRAAGCEVRARQGDEIGQGCEGARDDKLERRPFERFDPCVAGVQVRQ